MLIFQDLGKQIRVVTQVHTSCSNMTVYANKVYLVTQFDGKSNHNVRINLITSLTRETRTNGQSKPALLKCSSIRIRKVVDDLIHILLTFSYLDPNLLQF